MSSLFTELLFWGFLACMNLLACILVYNLTSLDLLQTHLSLGSPLPAPLRSFRSSSRSTSPPLSTRKLYTGPSFPPAFIYFSLLAALLNLGSSFVRLKQIHSLDFSVLSTSTLLTYLFVDLDQTTSSNPSSSGKPTLSIQDSRLILSLYDWMSLFVSLVFFLCAMYNFATVRNLVLRETERTSTMWVLGNSPSGTTFRKRTPWSWRTVTSYWTRHSDKEDDDDDEDEKELDTGRLESRGRLGDHLSNHSLSPSIRSRSHSQTLDSFLPPPPRQSPLLTRQGKFE